MNYFREKFSGMSDVRLHSCSMVAESVRSADGSMPSLSNALCATRLSIKLARPPIMGCAGLQRVGHMLCLVIWAWLNFFVAFFKLWGGWGEPPSLEPLAPWSDSLVRGPTGGRPLGSCGGI